MPAKSSRRTGFGRCNQPASHENSPRPPPSKKSARKTGCSHYDQSNRSGSGGWYYNAWRYRRALKVGPTSQPQDLVRCYEAMTPGIYKANLEAKIQAGTKSCCPEHRQRVQVQPITYENLLLPKRMEKKKARGSQSVGRKNTSVTGTRKLTRKNPGTEERCSNVEVDHPAGSNGDIESQGEGSQPSALWHARKQRKQVRFNEDSEWIDIDDGDNLLENMEGEEDKGGLFPIDEDEYILL